MNKTSFWRTKELISKNLKKSFYVFCLDMVFFIVLLLLNSLVLQRMPQPNQLYWQNPALIFIFAAAYLMFLLFFYSLIKYIVLLIIRSTYEEAEYISKNYFRFVFLNLILIGIAFLISVVISSILHLAVRQESIRLASIVVLAFLSLFFYLLFNIAQISFVIERRIWCSIKRSFAAIFKGNLYFPIIVNVIFFLLVYFIIGMFVVFLFKDNLFGVYRLTYTIIIAVLLYVLLFFNRMQLFVKIR